MSCFRIVFVMLDFSNTDLEMFPEFDLVNLLLLLTLSMTLNRLP